jgi:NIPSNAP protein
VISELRRYRIKPGRMDSWLAFFAEVVPQHKRHGIRVEYAGVDRETDTFVWLRSFTDEADREARKGEFYGSAWWAERETSAMDHVLEYEVTFLDAAIVSQDGEPTAVAWPASGKPAGSRGDSPPDGWATSTRRTFVPVRGTRS